MLQTQEGPRAGGEELAQEDEQANSSSVPVSLAREPRRAVPSSGDSALLSVWGRLPEVTTPPPVRGR